MSKGINCALPSQGRNAQSKTMTSSQPVESRSRTELRDIITEQLRRLIEQRNLEGAKGLLVPV